MSLLRLLLLTRGEAFECVEIWRITLTFKCVALCNGGGLLLSPQSMLRVYTVKVLLTLTIEWIQVILPEPFPH